jgi:pimeloyl-ACP methyl ester carboxylesterase
MKNVLLVHGAFSDGSVWSKVVPTLQAAGLNVVAAQLPLTSLADDVATTKRAIARMDGPLLLVGHSWGGAVITEAGNEPKVERLVYVAAGAPDAGQSFNDWWKDVTPAPGVSEIQADAFGFATLSLAGYCDSLMQDVPAEAARVAFVAQGPTAGACFDAAVTAAAWRTKPAWYIVAQNDGMVPTELQAASAKAMNATTLALPTGHVPQLSQPDAVADFIISAANGVKEPAEAGSARS